MRMLTAVLKDTQIQEYISENENSAFDYLKENFKIEPIYNYVIENINSFIDGEDLDYSYESIKAVARNYTLSLLNENGVLFSGMSQSISDMISDISRQFSNTTITELPNKVIAVCNSVPTVKSGDLASGFIKATYVSNEYSPVTPVKPNVLSDLDNYMHNTESLVDKIGNAARKAYEAVRDFITENPDKAALALAVFGFGLAIIYGANKIHKMSK